MWPARSWPELRLGTTASVKCLYTLQMVWDREACKDCKTFVPYVKYRANRLGEGNMEGMKVLGAHGIIEGQIANIVVQEHSDSPQVWWGVNGHLFAVVTHHPGVVAAAQHPWQRVLPYPLMPGSWLISYAHSVPMRKKKKSICEVRLVLLPSYPHFFFAVVFT